ncbi:hypothetical protein [Defluviimonas sp. WL0075]|uniref:Glycosyltransferase RgtA/B/C/D-like domain-containing protein n=1 Tax=Albidovulum sediminicola TaxID=2984331 RepID=A0ABT2Z746_9RHOB|nr:hypothetical protein [Defluviimonas sp. WL0075]MCV2866931.1 hypothetical protein [Defluviimonas sp. WL0075]
MGLLSGEFWQTVTFHLFAAQDVWVGPICAAMILAAVLLSRRWTPDLPHGRNAVFAAAVLAVALTAVFRVLAFQNFDLSVDEFMPIFQADIFRAGKLLASIDDLDLARRAQPYFTYVDESRLLWASHYRPVHAMLLALFPKPYETLILNSLLDGISVFATASVARQVFPDRRSAPVLAAALLISSAQFFGIGGAGFAFAAHLAFNMVWLSLFLKRRWATHILAAALGFFAVGLHQVHVHILFVAPFGIGMLLGYFGDRRFALPYLVSYCTALPLWVTWPEVSVWLQTGDASALPRSLRDIEYLRNYLSFWDATHAVDAGGFHTQLLLVSIWRFLVWLSPALPPLFLLGMFRLRSLGVVPATALASVLTMVVVTHILMPNQAHTWGARYYHPVLGALVIFGMGALYSLADADGLRRMKSLVVWLIIFGLVVLVPMRGIQIAKKVTPRAAVQDKLMALDADAVVIDPRELWYGADFVRNDPFLRNRPVFLFQNKSPLFGGRFTDIRIMTANDLIALGLPTGTLLEPSRPLKP